MVTVKCDSLLFETTELRKSNTLNNKLSHKMIIIVTNYEKHYSTKKMKLAGIGLDLYCAHGLTKLVWIYIV